MPPIKVSKPGTDLRTATGAGLTLDTTKPFAKLDSTNEVSFQLIEMLFLTDPPNPDGVVSFYQRNLVYHFPHGYTYVPSTWYLASTDGMQSAIGSEGVYLVGGGDFPLLSSAVFIAEADDTNIYFYIDKYYTVGALIEIPSILGFTLSVRAYIFVNDLAGTDIPSQA